MEGTLGGALCYCLLENIVELEAHKQFLVKVAIVYYTNSFNVMYFFLVV
jgi:hypothetical protein